MATTLLLAPAAVEVTVEFLLSIFVCTALEGLDNFYNQEMYI